MADQLKHLKDLKPDKKNARKRTPRGSDLLTTSLQELGAARSIVIDEDNVVLAGNGTVQAAAGAGIDRVLVVQVEGDTLVAVQRTGLTPAQKKRLAYLDNRTAELAAWNPEVIAADLNGGIDLADCWDEQEIDALMSTVAPPNFPPSGEDSQGRLDKKKPLTCPHCGKEFTP